MSPDTVITFSFFFLCLISIQEFTKKKLKKYEEDLLKNDQQFGKDDFNLQVIFIVYHVKNPAQRVCIVQCRVNMHVILTCSRPEYAY